MTTNGEILWHCCTDCAKGNHTHRCGGINHSKYDEGFDSLPLERFLAHVNNGCQECYDTLSPLEILNNIEL